MLFVFLISSCNNALEPKTQDNGKGAGRAHYSEVHLAPKGIGLYKALFQGRGPYVEEIPIVRDNYAASLFVTTAEEDSIYNAVSDMIVNAISDLDPTFFPEFRDKLISGDPFVIDDGIDQAAAITLQAAATLPFFQEQMEVAAEDDSLVSAILADIQEVNPESNANADSVSAALMVLAGDEEMAPCGPTYCVVYLELAVFVATYAALFQGGAVAVYNQLAIYKNMAIYDGKYLWKNNYWPWKRQEQPPDPNAVLGEGETELSYEMLLGFLASFYYWTGPEE